MTAEWNRLNPSYEEVCLIVYVSRAYIIIEFKKAAEISYTKAVQKVSSFFFLGNENMCSWCPLVGGCRGQ